MGWTFRLAHLEDTPLKVGDRLKRGDVLGTMGNTGQSFGAHGHIDVVGGRQPWVYRLVDIDRGHPEAHFEELHYFVDGELCGGKRWRITTYPYDPRYVIDGRWKPHPGVDIVIDDDDPVFVWNRSFRGEVIAAGFDAGYGNYVQVYYAKGT